MTDTLGTILGVTLALALASLILACLLYPTIVVTRGIVRLFRSGGEASGRHHRTDNDTTRDIPRQT